MGAQGEELPRPQAYEEWSRDCLFEEGKTMISVGAAGKVGWWKRIWRCCWDCNLNSNLRSGEDRWSPRLEKQEREHIRWLQTKQNKQK